MANGFHSVKQERKRQRTGSDTPMPASHANTASLTAESDEEQSSAKANATKKIKGTAVKNQKDKELKEKEKERERERAEQASKRSARAGRRRTDGRSINIWDHNIWLMATFFSASESPETAPTGSKPTDEKSAKPEAPCSPDTPPLNPISSNNQRKSGGRPSKRGGRLGRNQPHRDASAPEANDSTRNRMNADHDGQTNGNTSGGGEVASSGKGKARNYNPHKTGWTELRRRATGMLEIISRIQVDLAGEKTPPSAGSGSASTKGVVAVTSVPSASEPDNDNIIKKGDALISIPGTTDREFKELTSAEMMDALTRSLIAWQKKFGKDSEKA